MKSIGVRRTVWSTITRTVDGQIRSNFIAIPFLFVPSVAGLESQATEDTEKALNHYISDDFAILLRRRIPYSKAQFRAKSDDVTFNIDEYAGGKFRVHFVARFFAHHSIGRRAFF